MSKIVIAVDGFSSCGKSTLAKSLAKELEYAFIDTGAMYRAVTLYFLRQGLNNFKNLSDEKIEDLLNQISIDFRYNSKSDSNDTYLNGENVEDEIRNSEVSDAVSALSQIKQVRSKMVGLQQELGKKKGVVMDGRDIGTAVFPDAELKIFMTADPLVRAKRRHQELIEKDIKITFNQVKENLEKRDYEDTNRKENPLRQAKDAIVIDNTDMDREEQLRLVVRLAKEAIAQCNNESM